MSVFEKIALSSNFPIKLHQTFYGLLSKQLRESAGFGGLSAPICQRNSDAELFTFM